jgi:hypothetical protein
MRYDQILNSYQMPPPEEPLMTSIHLDGSKFHLLRTPQWSGREPW